MNPQAVVEKLSNILGRGLAGSFVEEFVSLEKAYFQQKWKYTELDGGRFCEAVSRIIYNVDSSNDPLNKSVDECLSYIENQKVPHNFSPLQSAFHVSKVVRSVYKLRSQRGGVHVSLIYTADEIDSRLIIENCRWLFCEILRVLCTSDKESVVNTMKELSRFSHPFVRKYGDKVLIQIPNIKTEDEIIILLYWGGEEGLGKQFLINNVKKDSSGTRRALKRLSAGNNRQVIELGDMVYITDLGIKRVEQLLSNSRHS